jgi:F-type H+-transporting ATPase subunit delta
VTPRDISRAARSIFDILHARGESLPAVAALDALSALMTEHGDLHKALVSPFVPAAGKQGILDELAPRLAMPDVIRRSLHILAEQGALNDVPALSKAVRRLVHRQAGIVEAQVTTAVPLTEAQVAHLQDTLSQATGKQVTVTAKVDPSVLGGVVAHVGGVVFDGTLSRQLDRLEEQLVQRG